VFYFFSAPPCRTPRNNRSGNRRVDMYRRSRSSQFNQTALLSSIHVYIARELRLNEYFSQQQCWPGVVFFIVDVYQVVQCQFINLSRPHAYSSDRCGIMLHVPRSLVCFSLSVCIGTLVSPAKKARWGGRGVVVSGVRQ